MKALLIMVIAMLLVGFVSAQPEFSLPAHARELAPGVYNVGTAVHNGRVVDGIAFVDYVRTTPSKGPKQTTCYSFIARGAKWKSVEPWVLNPTNIQNISSTFLLSNIGENMAKWEIAAGANIFGTGTVDTGVAANPSVLDGINTVSFGAINSPGAIAVTTVWGVFSGPAGRREIVEWDQIYDQYDYPWSASGEAWKMDFENIATHELGHALGLGHPGGSCTEETMYAYASYGETKKRDLNTGDIAGAQVLYK